MTDWIKTTDRLPAEDESVLLHVQWSCESNLNPGPLVVGYCKIRTEPEWWTDDCLGIDGTVTHWQPLPAPPEPAPYDWINVSDRLPTERKLYNVVRENQYGRWSESAYFDPEWGSGAWLLPTGVDDPIFDVTHWQRLPEPPEPGVDNL